MSETPLFGLTLSHPDRGTLSEQIYAALRSRIVSGQLAAADRLPPSRKLATELGVSRTTVVTAYDQLVAEGFAEGRVGSGIYVSQLGQVENIAARVHPQTASSQTLAQNDHPRPFMPGQPDLRLFPHREWARCVARVSRMAPHSLVRTDDPFGDRSLRQEICRYLYEWRGLSASLSQVLITAGAMEGLELCARSLIPANDALLMENPCYPPLRNFAESLGIPIQWLEHDAQGAVPPATNRNNRNPALTVLTPSSQFPLGGAMPLARRNAFLTWAATRGAWIVEDDYDSEFRYAGRPIPALAGLDEQERTLYVGSFAKVFSSGLRLGFVVIPTSLVTRFRETINRFGVKASAMPQRPLALLMRDGGYYRHIRRVRRVYSERRKQFIGLLRTHLGDCASFDDYQAGMHIAVRLPAHLLDTAIASEAERSGVSCIPLSSYYAGTGEGNGLVLGFCAYTPDEMQSAMIQLRRSIDSLL